jgi:hypothetical protein
VFLAQSDFRLLQEPSQALQGGPPEVAAYEFQSHGIVGMLEKLRDKFVDERSLLEQEEASKKHGHEMLVQDLSASVKSSENTKALKATHRAKNLQTAATMKGDLADATRMVAEEEKAFLDITTTCDQKTSDFQERQKLRDDEIIAINKAIEILSSDVPPMPTMLAQRSTAFVQLRSSTQSPEQARAIKFLNQEADKINSQVLSALAVRVQDDPFIKVKKLIQDLITRLVEEANEAAQHQAWCDAELAENGEVRTSRTTLAERLSSEIEQMNAAITKLGSEVTLLTQEVAETEQQIAELTQKRQTEKATNEQTVKDAQDAQTAVQTAVTLLREFYAQAGEATALFQKRHLQSRLQEESLSLHAQHLRRQEPAIFDGAYKGMGAESGGVLGMLEVIQSDYARLESTTTAMEQESLAAFERFMSDAKVSKATAETDIEHKNREKQATEQAVMDATSDLASAQKELEAANNYFEKLKPSCLNTGTGYEERTARRKEEIQSLKEALQILAGESA